MIKITLEEINRKSPYEIILINGDFDFSTDTGTRYSVSFLEDVPLGGCDTYQFGFRKREDSHSGYDSKVKDTLIAIIEQFFAENDNVLLYICDTSDGREAKRNRLFVRWFEEFATPERFTMKTANATVEGQDSMQLSLWRIATLCLKPLSLTSNKRQNRSHAKNHRQCSITVLIH